MKRILIAAAVLALLAGCTTITYEPESGVLTYRAILQRKSLEIRESGDGTIYARYATDSDAVIELAREVTRLAEMAAATGAQGGKP